MPEDHFPTGAQRSANGGANSGQGQTTPATATTQLRISGKNLGQLSLTSFCPRCFWLRMRCRDRLPWQIFPGIFSSIDAYTKKVTNLHFGRHRRIPRWFDGFGDLGEPIAVPHHSVFRIVDDETNILLTGVPDEVFRRPDGSLFIADDKTARFTGNQDELLPMYVTQLNSYAVIAERIGLGRIVGLGLVYHEPQTDIGQEDVDSVCGNDGFSMRFAAKLLPIELRPATIPPLLRQVREICDRPTAPAARAGCEDCRRLDRLMEAVGTR
ncbi:hypothetical protein HQ590_14100 [bacterium]|nr:hypothetical protein [bacterium]